MRVRVCKCVRMRVPVRLIGSGQLGDFILAPLYFEFPDKQQPAIESRGLLSLGRFDGLPIHRCQPGP